MAKKQSAKARAAEEEAARQEKSDRQYGSPLFSLTYEMDELEFSRAASLFGNEREKNLLTAISITALAFMVLLLVQSPSNLTPSVILMIISVVATSLSSRWGAISAKRARRTTLGLEGADNRRHIVVTEDYVVEEGPDDRVEKLPVWELKSFRANDEYALADFGNKRCVFIPRSAMSEGRYRSLVRFFEGHAPKRRFSLRG